MDLSLDLAQTISVLWTGEPLQHSKTINFVLNIFKKILLNPKDAKYGNLNLRRVQKRIETTPNVIHLLFKAGFIESPDRTRLLWIYSDENYHSLKTVNDSVERKIMTKEPQNESPKSVLQTQLYDENAISALLEMGLNRDDCIMASQLAANYKDPTSIFEALAGLLPTLKDPNPPPKQDKPVPMFNNDTLAHVLCSQALSQYFHMNSQAMRQSLASDQNNMQKLEQLRNEILSMEPTRLDWHQPHVSEDDLCRCCPDYSKIRPTRQDIAARNNQNDFKYFNGMALLNAMQQGTVIRETLNITCSALDTCPGLTTICAVLQRYQWFVASHQIDHEKNVKFADYFGDDYNGVHTLNNFHHLLFDHHAQFEDIYDALINEMSIGCSLQKCQVIRRHYRDRLTDNDCGSDEVMESMELSLLDKIHCYYLHSFDIGYKFRKHVQDKLWNERRHESHDEENKENDAIENDTHNSLDGAIHTLITSNRRSYEAVEGLDRILNGNNRFHTEMDEKTDGMTFRLNKTWLYQRGLMRSNQSTASFLDVEWLSDYPNEQERFFIGGYARFSIESIVMWPNINYEKYLTAMRAIWQKIGYLHISPPILSNCTTKLAYKMLSHEFHRYWPNNKHYDSFNAMDEYAEKLFHNFCINLRVVWFFAMKRGCGTYEKMDKFLDHMFLYDNGMPKLKETMTLFPSATEIRIKTNCNGTSKDNVQMISNHSFWKLLLVDLKQTSSLTELIVEFSSNAKCADVIKTMGEQYATQLNRIGWKVAHGTSQRYANPDHTLIIEADKPSRKVVTD
eukprot:178774_1